MSGFYSRKRKGQPRYYVEWSPREQRAFEVFAHANDLAEALFSDGELGAQALNAMTGILHVSTPQLSWFDDPWDLFYGARRPFFVLRQGRLRQDFAAMARKLSLPVEISLPEDRTSAHRNDYAGVPPLSDLAIKNLQRWYAADIEFFRLAQAYAVEQLALPPEPKQVRAFGAQRSNRSGRPTVLHQA